MLPGFRFLVGAVVLSIALLVFGFGAVALLRSAHDEFASLPIRRAPPPVFGSLNSEAPPSLTMLRIEAPEPQAAVAEPAAVSASADLSPPAPSPVETMPSTEPETIASLSPARPAPEPAPAVDASAREAAIAVPSAPEAPAPVVAGPASPAADTAAAEPAVTGSVAAASVVERPAGTLTEADTQLAATTVATLGGPPVDIEPVPVPKAKPAARREKSARKEIQPKRRRRDARAEMQPAPPASTPPFGWPPGQ